MPLLRYSVFVEAETGDEAEGLLDEIASAVCGGFHDPDDPDHECGREFAVLVGVVDDADINWQREVAQAFTAVLPKVELEELETEELEE